PGPGRRGDGGAAAVAGQPRPARRRADVRPRHRRDVARARGRDVPGPGDVIPPTNNKGHLVRSSTMRRHHTFLATTIAGLGLLVAACGGPAPATTAPSSAPAAVVSVSTPASSSAIVAATSTTASASTVATATAAPVAAAVTPTSAATSPNATTPAASAATTSA